jgi:hypothetical protein
MPKRIYGICEAAILVLLGVTILWFALSANYGLLMNVKFKWLTVTGAALLLVLGVVALDGRQKQRGLNTLIFALMLLITFWGRPFLPDANTMKLLEPPEDTGLWEQVDLNRFPKKRLQELYLKEADQAYGADATFSIIGVAKRVDALDTNESFAVMQTMMACCIADALSIGFRVPYEDWENIEDGDWILVSGKLAEEETPITVPNFRFGRAMMSSIHETYYLQPEKVISFEWEDQLPLLTELLDGERSSLFARALQETGLWQTLQEKGPYTVFVPVNKAIEDLSGVSFDGLSPVELKQFVSSHIVAGKLLSRELLDLEELENLVGRSVSVESVNGKPIINQSRLLFKDRQARNGVVHFIYPAIILDEWVGQQ